MTKAPPLSLEQLLRRSDLWRGHSHAFVKEEAIDSGYPKLNQALQQGGWPSTSMIEVCQSYHASEWWLFHPAINALIQPSNYGHIALLNPPALPFISGLQQLDIDTRRIFIVQTKTTQEFVRAFTELSQSAACPVLFAWQSSRGLNYTQLRKLQLSSLEHAGLRVIFRHSQAKEQNSPASLRLSLQAKHDSLKVKIFKQKGKLRQSDIALPIPAIWRALPPHHKLHHGSQDISHDGYTAADNSQAVILPKIASRPLEKAVKRDT